jgi:hypothetical protein
MKEAFGVTGTVQAVWNYAYSEYNKQYIQKGRKV